MDNNASDVYINFNKKKECATCVLHLEHRTDLLSIDFFPSSLRNKILIPYGISYGNLSNQNLPL